MRTNIQQIPNMGLRVLAACVFAGVLSSCTGDGSGAPVTNERPSIRITEGPIEGRRDSYTTEIWWIGWDDDGIVDHYQFMLDPPEEFSAEEINRPEEFLTSAGGDLELEVVPGFGEKNDRLRFFKGSGEDRVFMEYRQTLDFHRSFNLETPESDTTFGTSDPSGLFTGYHTIYVRSIDNENLGSDVDRVAFTATNISPSAIITRPRIDGAGWLTVGPQIRISWDGVDLDGQGRKPVGYFHKLVRLEDLTPEIPIFSADPTFVVYRAAADIPWTFQSAASTEIRYVLKPGSYVFAVRAMDVNGAVEPFVERVRRGGAPGNAMIMEVKDEGGFPRVNVIEESLGINVSGSAEFTSDVFQAPFEQGLIFSWQASAESYGGTIAGFNWGINIADLDAEGPGSGWSGWGQAGRNPEAIVFEKPGLNYLYVKCRDIEGAVTVMTIIIDVIKFDFSRRILVVDDYRDEFWPRDAEHDDFWRRMVVNSGRFSEVDLRADVWYTETFGVADTEFSRIIPKLDFWGKYQLIIYDTKGSGLSGWSGLADAGPQKKYLRTYLSSGGKVWVTGEQTAVILSSSRFLSSNWLALDFSYPKDFQPESFGYGFFKVYSHDIRNAKYMLADTEGMWGVKPFGGVPEIFPAMQVDPLKMSPFARGRFGVGGSDVIFGPIQESDNPNHRGVIDSVYAFEGQGPRLLPVPKNSKYQDKLCAVRWHDPDPARKQGRVMWFGVPVYWFHDEQFQETFNRAIDWFQEEKIQ